MRVAILRDDNLAGALCGEISVQQACVPRIRPEGEIKQVAEDRHGADDHVEDHIGDHLDDQAETGARPRGKYDQIERHDRCRGVADAGNEADQAVDPEAKAEEAELRIEKTREPIYPVNQRVIFNAGVVDGALGLTIAIVCIAMRARACHEGLAKRFGQLWHRGEKVRNKPVIGDLKDWRFLVLVDGHDNL